MQLPQYIDTGLAHKPDDLPHVLTDSDDPVVWRLIGDCTIRGVERSLCLAFAVDTGMAVRLGVLSPSGDSVESPSWRARRIQFVRRTKPLGANRKPGMSLLLLQQVAVHMEGVLVRDFLNCKYNGESEKSEVARLILEIYGIEGPPAGVSAEDVLFLISATKAAREFYDARLFGGRDNLNELIGAFGYVYECLDSDQQEELAPLIQDLQKLDDLDDLRIDGFAELQRHVTVYILALLRHQQWLRNAELPLQA